MQISLDLRSTIWLNGEDEGLCETFVELLGQKTPELISLLLGKYEKKLRLQT